MKPLVPWQLNTLLGATGKTTAVGFRASIYSTPLMDPTTTFLYSTIMLWSSKTKTKST
jgi:hypothetical protein